MRALILLMAVGCATGAAQYGSVTFKSFSNAAARPVSYSVGAGHVVGTDLDLREDQGCVRGNWGRIPLDFCRDDRGTGAEQHWSGSSGEFTVQPVGDRVAVRGQLILDTRRIVSMDQEVAIGRGTQWDELRKHPALLAVAATAADMQARRPQALTTTSLRLRGGTLSGLALARCQAEGGFIPCRHVNREQKRRGRR